MLPGLAVGSDLTPLFLLLFLLLVLLRLTATTVAMIYGPGYDMTEGDDMNDEEGSEEGGERRGGRAEGGRCETTREAREIDRLASPPHPNPPRTKNQRCYNCAVLHACMYVPFG